MPGRDSHEDSDDDSITNRPLNRRRFLGRASAAGAGTFGLTAASAGAGAGFVDDTVEIDAVRSRDKPPITKEVPGAWYRSAQRSRRVRDVLQEQYGEESWLGAINRHAGTKKIEGLREFEITVEATDVTTARREVPDVVDGFEIHVDEHEEPTPQWCNTGNYGCVPGGSYVVVKRNDGNYAPLSATIVVYHGGGLRLMTAAHGFLTSCSDDIRGNPLYQGSSWQYVGRVGAWSSAQDWAMVVESSNSDIGGLDNRIAGHLQKVDGHVPKSEVDRLIASDETVYKYGAKTCRTDGTLTGEISYKYCHSYQPFVQSSADSSSGDSGGPHYNFYKRDGSWEIAVIGVNHGSGSGVSVAPAAYKIHNDHDIWFGFYRNNC